jgi:hypothetical protein
MKNRLETMLILGLFGLLCLQYCGCTLIGFGIGSAIDASSPYPKYVSPQEILAIENSSQVAVTTRDTLIYGQYLGPRFIPADTYAKSYHKWKEESANGGFMISPWDSVVVWSRENRRANKNEAQFVGFIPDGIRLETWKNHTMISESDVPVNNVDSVTNNHGITTPGQLLREQMRGRNVPFMIEIMIKQPGVSGDTMHLPLEKVVSIQSQTHPKGASTVGAITGAVIDAAIIIVSVVAMQTFSSSLRYGTL